jgi:hypothetical protein
VRILTRLSLLGCLIALLAGCTPEYNWRESTVAEDRGVIMFPSRTKIEQRQIEVEGAPASFSLISCAVGDAVFSVGYVPLPAALTGEKSAAFVKTIVSSLAARAGKQAPEAALKGEIFTLDTVVANQPSMLMAKVVVHRGMLIQVVVSGPKQSLSNENALEFVRSLRLR